MMKHFISILAMVLLSVVHDGSYGSIAASPATWTKTADFGGGPNRGAVWFTLQGAAYVVCGIKGDSVPDNQCWKYDSVVNTWTRKADFPGKPIIEGAGFAIGTKGYVTLGSDNNMAALGYPTDLWEYDSVQDTWTKKAAFKGSGRAGAAVTVIDRKAYIYAGGQWPASTAELWEYNPAIDIWTKKNDCPGGGRLMPMAFTVGNKGYFGLGKSSAAEPKDFYEYDPAADRWKRKADFPGSAIAYAIGMNAGNKGYVGLGVSAFRPVKKTREVWEYDPVSDAWTRMPDLSGEARSMAVGFSLGSDIYFGMGHNAAFRNLSDLWRLRPSLSIDPDISFTDVDGNTYSAKKIGSRYWMTSNFNANRGPKGESLHGIYSYNDEPGIALSYGRLYTWPAALQAAPSGWRLPTAEDWQELISLHGGSSVAGGQMKETGTTHWRSPNTGAANTLGYTAVGGGFRGSDGVFRDLGVHGSYWGSTSRGRDSYCVYVYGNATNALSDSSLDDKTSGIAFAVRYVKD